MSEADISSRWRLAVDKVKSLSARHGTSLAFGRLLKLSDGEVVLAYGKGAEFHRGTVSAASGKTVIEKALSECFGRPTRLTLQDLPAGQDAPLSLAEQDVQTRESRDKKAEANIRSHPAVLSALRILGGQLEYVQILDGQAQPPSTLDVVDEGG